MGIKITDVDTVQRRSILALFGDHLVRVEGTDVEFIWTDAKECLDEFDRVIDKALWRGSKGGWGYLAETALLNGTRGKIANQVNWAGLEADAEDGYLAQGVEL